MGLLSIDRDAPTQVGNLRFLTSVLSTYARNVNQGGRRRTAVLRR